MKLSDTHGQTTDFDLPSDAKNVGVNCSGGADSSILLYMVCDYVKQYRPDVKISVVTCANDAKHRWNVRKAADVINFTIDRLGFNPIDMHYAYYRDRQSVEYFHDVESRLYQDGRIDMMVSGITANPKLQAIVTDSRGRQVDLSVEALPDRNSDNSPAMHQNSAGMKFYTPFVNVDKRFVAAMYDQYQVPELFDLTRSCEALPDADAVFDPEFEKTPCGTCWWCLERKWAFGRL